MIIGTTIGNYRVTKLLGKGGMGAVYEAQHVHINRRVALKLLLPQFVETPDIVQRFVNEALAVNTISHPGIVQVSDQGRTADGGLYMVMELLEGETLGERSKRLGGRLSESSVVRIGAQVASALAAAHEKQIIHRDIKPGNIMLVTDSSAPSGERVKVLDFGIAKVQATALHTKTGQMIGTAAFMSPEQIRGSSAIDGRSDVYSLGVLLYLLLAGSPPFPPPKSDIELVTQHLLDPPIPLVESAPDVSAAVVDLVMQMLAKKATERPTMEEVATVLQSLASAAEVSQVALAKALPATLMVSEPATSGTPWPEAATRPSSSSQTTGRSAVTPRRRTAIMVAGVTAVAVLIAVGITLLRKGISDPSPVVAVPARTLAAQTDRVPAEAAPSKQGAPTIAPPLSSAGRPSGVTSAAAALPAAGSGVAVDSRSALVKSKSSAPINRRPLSSNRHGKAASSALPPRTSGRSISPKISNGKTTSTPIIR